MLAGLKHYAKYTEKHLCRSFFFNKVAGLRPTTLLKKRLWHRYYPGNFVMVKIDDENNDKSNVNISEIFKNIFFIELFRPLLLYYGKLVISVNKLLTSFTKAS